MREGRVEVVLVDDAGRHQGYGRLVRRRRVGGYLVQLAADVAGGMWWVVATRVEPSRQVFIGFVRRRRADGVHVFDHVTEAGLDRGANDRK